MAKKPFTVPIHKIPMPHKYRSWLKFAPVKKVGKFGAAIFVVLVLVGILLPKPQSQKIDPPPEGVWIVRRCVDGDTLLLDSPVKPDPTYTPKPEGERLRLIGADTPETVRPNTPVQFYGPEASLFTKMTIEAAENRVRLVWDGDIYDKYDRLLAMVYVQTTNGEILLNEELIRLGFARAMTQYSYSQAMKNRFQKAQSEAQTAKRGVWSAPVQSP